MKIQKKLFFFWGGGQAGGGGVGGRSNQGLGWRRGVARFGVGG